MTVATKADDSRTPGLWVAARRGGSRRLDRDVRNSVRRPWLRFASFSGQSGRIDLAAMAMQATGAMAAGGWQDEPPHLVGDQRFELVLAGEDSPVPRDRRTLPGRPRRAGRRPARPWLGERRGSPSCAASARWPRRGTRRCRGECRVPRGRSNTWDSAVGFKSMSTRA